MYRVPKLKLLVEKQYVYDFKDQDGYLKLIHEPYPGYPGYSKADIVEIRELESYVDLPIMSETLEKELVSADLVEIENVLYLNLTA